MKIKVITKSPEETMLVAEKFGRSLTKSCVISLEGDLSAGKTTFAKGFAKGIGINQNITSPTFTILNEYEGKKMNLYHFDMYRIKSIDEALALGFEEYFDQNNLKGIVLVEWASNVQGLLPNEYYHIDFSKLSDEERKIEISYINKKC